MGSAIPSQIGFPNQTDKAQSFGFKFSDGGPHIGRTMLLEDITRLLSVVPAGAEAEVYRQAIVDNNVLRKETETTRRETFRRLRELYGLSEKVPMFSAYRDLVAFDPDSIALLSLLVAWTRDPLLRGTTSAIFSASVGSTVTGDDVRHALMERFPNHHNAPSIAKIARYTASTWTQSGHLVGRTKKIRQRVQPRPAAVTLALLLAHVSDFHGEALFTSPWCRLLDLTPGQATSLGTQAHRENLLNLKIIGSVVEIDFPRFIRFPELKQ